MDIITYTYAISLFFAPDGVFKGGEARQATGFEELVDVPDAPGGKTSVFHVVKPEELIPLTADMLASYLPDQATMLADLAAKAAAVNAWAYANAEMRTAMEVAQSRVVELEGVVAEQKSTLEQVRVDAAAAKIVHDNLVGMLEQKLRARS